MRIRTVNARKILDSRGDLTVEVDVLTDQGMGRASAPSGASVGKYEARSLPEGGIDAALEQMACTVAPALVGRSVDDQPNLDKILQEVDGTVDFSKIGASASLATSMAIAKAAAASRGVPLYHYLAKSSVGRMPAPLGNVLGGGKHAKGKTLDVQEILVVSPGARSFRESAWVNSMVHRLVGQMIPGRDATFAGGKTDEGAWTAMLTTKAALSLVNEACNKVGGERGVNISLGVDLAASSLWETESSTYAYGLEGAKRDSDEQFNYVCDLIEEFNLHYVEDPFHEDDWLNFSRLTRKYRPIKLICGDDLFVTNVERLKVGVEKEAANCVIIKPNQCGTITKAFQAAEYAKRHGLTLVVSHRSGETEDAGLSHLALALGAEYIKSGAVGGERTVKLNELIRIEESLRRA